MRLKLVDEAKKQFPIHRLCSALAVSESGYYAWKHRDPSQRQLDDMVLLAHIRSQFELSHEAYGPPRMHVELCEYGVQVGRHRVARLVRDNGIKALQKRRHKKTTDRDHGGLVEPNLLDQDFSCDGPDRKWGVDIGYMWTREGWLYLAIVLDLYSRRIVDWETSDRLKKVLAITALKRAIATRQLASGLTHHSDRGSQYCSHDYRKLLITQGMHSSMSGKGNCHRNSKCEWLSQYAR